jgi:hypothetical protein
MPAKNAIAYGEDWKCKYGYFKENGSSCEKLPKNSFGLASGGWKCKAGFNKINNKCIKK